MKEVVALDVGRHRHAFLVHHLAMLGRRVGIVENDGVGFGALRPLRPRDARIDVLAAGRVALRRRHAEGVFVRHRAAVLERIDVHFQRGGGCRHSDQRRTGRKQSSRTLTFPMFSSHYVLPRRLRR